MCAHLRDLRDPLEVGSVAAPQPVGTLAQPDAYPRVATGEGSGGADTVRKPMLPVEESGVFDDRAATR